MYDMNTGEDIKNERGYSKYLDTANVDYIDSELPDEKISHITSSNNYSWKILKCDIQNNGVFCQYCTFWMINLQRWIELDLSAE